MRRALAAPVLAALALIALPSLALSAPAPATAPLATASGEVDSGTRKDGEIRFSVRGRDATFVAREAAMPDASAFWDALVSSSRAHDAVLVRFDARTGRFEAGGAQPAYAPAAISYEGADIGGDPTPPVPAAAADPAAAARNRLAEAAAHTDDGQFQAAIDGATAALDSGRLDTALQVLALKLRADLESDEAISTQPPGPDRDRLTLAALNDARAWRRLAPDDTRARMAEAGALRDLGAYDEALAIFAGLAAGKETNDIHWGLIRQATIYRIRGDYARSLALLDELKAKLGGDVGMAFHYHRGWTLIEMGRLDEAVAELTQGLASQPDYWGAFDRRACALGRLGRLREALADLQESDRLERQWAATTPVRTPNALHDDARRRELIASVQPAVAAGQAKPVDVCGGYWDFGEHRQDRSPLLPVKG